MLIATLFLSSRSSSSEGDISKHLISITYHRLRYFEDLWSPFSPPGWHQTQRSPLSQLTTEKWGILHSALVLCLMLCAVYAFSTDNHRQNGWIALDAKPRLENLLYCQNSPNTRLWGQGPARPQFLHF